MAVEMQTGTLGIELMPERLMLALPQRQKVWKEEISATVWINLSCKQAQFPLLFDAFLCSPLLSFAPQDQLQWAINIKLFFKGSLDELAVLVYQYVKAGENGLFKIFIKRLKRSKIVQWSIEV